MKKAVIILSILLTCTVSFGQVIEPAIPPLKLPIEFSGTYGELRTDHFHAGFDFRTGGVTGHQVFAIKDGYISRVSVSPGGYGNGLYINHKDGTMSVYGHLSKFTDEIAAKVLEEQYKNEKFNINLFFGPNDFPVKQGELIGLSGNTGSSGGPHLHMEIRRQGGELPTNFLRDGVYNYPDNLVPVIQRVGFYAYEDSTGYAQHRKLTILSSPSETVKVPAKSYIAVDAIDKLPGSPYKMGVEVYRVLLDGEEFFRFTVGDVSYSEQSYIKSMIAYGESGSDMIKTQVDPGNALKYKVQAKNNGVIILDDYAPHKLRVEAIDYTGNVAGATYTIVRDDSVKALTDDDSLSHYNMLWYTPNTLNTKEISVTLPSGALYNSCDFTYGKVADADPEKGIYSSVWRIGDPTTPLAKSATVKFKVDAPDSLKSKMILARYDASTGKITAAGGKYENNGVVLRTSSLDTYCVTLDTIPPTLIPITAKEAQISSSGEVYFTMKDEFSGISDFLASCDGEWVLGLLKGSRLTIYLDTVHHRKGLHHISVTAIDGCGNTTDVDLDVFF
ncbi:MAG: M23 family metallopeptidase [Bacteroidales bacterium]|nr:M23 family metallopeptidase [Bacteroidales bacterium]